MKSTFFIRTPRCLAVLLLPLLAVWGCGKRADVTGKWDGTVDTSSIAGAVRSGHATMHIVLTIRREGDQIKATVATPDEGPGETSADTVEFKDNSLTVKVSKRLSIYEATLNSNGTELNGRFKQAPYNLPLALKKSSGF